MYCPWLSFCDNEVTKEEYETLCKGEFERCEYFRKKHKARAIPRRWMHAESEERLERKLEELMRRG